MKNSLSKIVLATMIAAAPLAAEYSFDTSSLFGIEGGISNVSSESGNYDEEGIPNIGLKIGAQTENYRIFLGARYYVADKLESLSTYGAEVQYMFNFSKPVNFFIGANGGMANVKLKSGSVSESTSELYYGADAGFNIHALKMLDIEIGARFLSIQDAKIAGEEINDIVTGYASLIVRWEMD